VTKQSTDLADLELMGLEEIRKALEEVESLRKQGFDARLELVECMDTTNLRVTLCSFKELQEYISHRFSRMLMSEITSAIPLDDFERIVSETSTNILKDSNNLRGRVLVK